MGLDAGKEARAGGLETQVLASAPRHAEQVPELTHVLVPLAAQWHGEDEAWLMGNLKV